VRYDVSRLTLGQKELLLEKLWRNQAYAFFYKLNPGAARPVPGGQLLRKNLQVGIYIDYLCGKPFFLNFNTDIWDLSTYLKCFYRSRDEHPELVPNDAHDDLDVIMAQADEEY
jgi:hypothetical protein